MNKKLILLGSIALIASGQIGACKLTVANDTDKTVIFQSRKNAADRLELKEGEIKPFGNQVDEHGEMADLDLTVIGSMAAPIHMVQTTCSSDFKTFLKVSEVIGKKFSEKNAKLFTFDNVQAGTCGCKAGEKK